MITPICSKCGRAILPDDVNVGNDVALCRYCNLSFKLSTLTHGEDISVVDMERPPEGAWYRSDGIRTAVGATHRSLGGAIGLLAISLFWNGITSVFVALALSSTFALFDWPAPSWFPKPIMNQKAMGAGITIFLWLFLTPFILIGLAMIGGFLSCLGGRTEVRISSHEALIFSGIGSLGFRKRFSVATAKDVRIEAQRTRSSDDETTPSKEIVVELHEGKPVKFGSSLTDERRHFVAAALRKTLLK